MASTLAIPHFVNYPGSIPGAIPGPIPPVSVPVNPQFSSSHPVTTANVTCNINNVPVPTVQVPVVPVGGGCYNDGMEVVWHGEFSRLFSNFYPPHVWYLTITNQAPEQKWKFHRDSAKVRFCCQDCGNGWTSMKGRVTFWFFLDYENNAGFVQFKLYGQQCKKCNSGKFEYVMWYPEEVSKVMCNVYNKVGQTYYGFLQPPIRIDRRPGRPRNQHNAELCQACRDGECDQGRPMKPLLGVNGLMQSPLAVPAPPISTVASSTVLSPANPSSSEASSVTSINLQPTTRKAATPDPSGKQMQFLSSGVMTSPVALGNGVQPILTYSVMGGTAKSTPLTFPSNHIMPQNAPLPQVNNHYIYHPTPAHILGGTIPIHSPPVYPILPPKTLIYSDVKPPLPPRNVASITKSLEATKITEIKEDQANSDATKSKEESRYQPSEGNNKIVEEDVKAESKTESS